MKYLVFCHDYKGHYLEYINHVYLYAARHLSDSNVVFVLNPAIQRKLNLMEWPECCHIQIEYLTDSECLRLSQKHQLWHSFTACDLLNRYAQKTHPDFIILFHLAAFLPFLMLMCRRWRNSIRGLLYKVARYRVNISRVQRMTEDALYKWLVKSKCINRVWLLNDEKSPIEYNTQYKTSKFHTIPDPIVVNCTGIEPLPLPNLSDKVVLLHAGGMGQRKGTHIILEALSAMPSDIRSKIALILAGSISEPNIRQMVDSFYNEFSTEMVIVRALGFIPFAHLQACFQVADYVLIPYSNVEQSSGILGYAAYFGKPVIGPAQGLLGQLIKDNNLGIAIPAISVGLLQEIITDVVNERKPLKMDTTEYVRHHSADSFSKVIFEK